MSQNAPVVLASEAALRSPDPYVVHCRVVVRYALAKHRCDWCAIPASRCALLCHSMLSVVLRFALMYPFARIPCAYRVSQCRRRDGLAGRWISRLLHCETLYAYYERAKGYTYAKRFGTDSRLQQSRARKQSLFDGHSSHGSCSRPYLGGGPEPTHIRAGFRWLFTISHFALDFIFVPRPDFVLASPLRRSRPLVLLLKSSYPSHRRKKFGWGKTPPDPWARLL